MFNILRKLSRKNRKSPKESEVLPGKVVPTIDYELLKYIKLQLANGHDVVVSSREWDEQQHLVNVKVLYGYYNMTPHELLIATGIWVHEKI